MDATNPFSRVCEIRVKLGNFVYPYGFSQYVSTGEYLRRFQYYIIGIGDNE